MNVNKIVSVYNIMRGYQAKGWNIEQPVESCIRELIEMIQKTNPQHYIKLSMLFLDKSEDEILQMEGDELFRKFAVGFIQSGILEFMYLMGNE